MYNDFCHSDAKDMKFVAPKIQQKRCLATISSKDYWPGTRQMIKSFLHYNGWFTGDILILTEDSLPHFSLKNHDVRYQAPSAALLEKIELLCQDIPFYRTISARFFVLDLFLPSSYEEILYIDSDILFTAAIEPELLFAHNISMVPDPWHFRGFRRRRSNLQKIQSEIAGLDCYPTFFNSGLICARYPLFSPETHRGLLQKVDSGFLGQLEDCLADEPILNSYFEGKINALLLHYNCPVHLIMEGLVEQTPSGLHFTGKNKPWKWKSWWRLPLRRLAYLKFLMLWITRRTLI